MTQSGNRKLNEIIGQQVTDWECDLDLTLKFSGGSKYTGLLIGEFVIRNGSKEIFHHGSEEKLAAPSKVMNALIGAEIVDAIADKAGDLSIRFKDGTELVALHAERVESWEFRWIGTTIVSLPGGGIEEFSTPVKAP
jgi:hypothetical protein